MVCSFSPDGSHIVAGANDCSIYVWSWSILQQLQETSGGCTAPASAADGDIPVPIAAASAAAQGCESWWVLAEHKPEELCRLEGHKNDVVLLQFSLDGQGIATGSKDGTVRVSIPACMLYLVTSMLENVNSCIHLHLSRQQTNHVISFGPKSFGAQDVVCTSAHAGRDAVPCMVRHRATGCMLERRGYESFTCIASTVIVSLLNEGKCPSVVRGARDLSWCLHQTHVTMSCHVMSCHLPCHLHEITATAQAMYTAAIPTCSVRITVIRKSKPCMHSDRHLQAAACGTCVCHRCGGGPRGEGA